MQRQMGRLAGNKGERLASTTIAKDRDRLYLDAILAIAGLRVPVEHIVPQLHAKSEWELQS